MLDRDKFLSEYEARKLMEYAEAKNLLALERGTVFYVKAWTVIHTLLGTGIRASECRKIRIKDLRLTREPSVRILGKGGRARTVEISNDLKNHLKQFLQFKRRIGEGTEPEDYLFLSKMKRYYTLAGIQQLFKKMAKEAGLRPEYSTWNVIGGDCLVRPAHKSWL